MPVDFWANDCAKVCNYSMLQLSVKDAFDFWAISGAKRGDSHILQPRIDKCSCQHVELLILAAKNEGMPLTSGDLLCQSVRLSHCAFQK